MGGNSETSPNNAGSKNKQGQKPQAHDRLKAIKGISRNV